MCVVISCNQPRSAPPKRPKPEGSVARGVAAAAASALLPAAASIVAPTLLFSSQIQTGDLVLSKLRAMAARYVDEKRLEDKDPSWKITDLSWHVVVPRTISICTQTTQRMSDAMGNSRSNIDRQVCAPDMRGANSKALPNRRLVAKFCEHAKANPSVLHILVFDEAHWGAQYCSTVHQMMANPTMLESRNLFILGSTATPYIVSAHLFPPHSIVTWQNANQPSVLTALIRDGKVEPRVVTTQEIAASLRYHGMESYAADPDTHNALRDYVAEVRPAFLQETDLLALLANANGERRLAEDVDEQQETGESSSGVRVEYIEEMVVALDYCHALVEVHDTMLRHQQQPRGVAAGAIALVAHANPSSSGFRSSDACRRVMRALLSPPAPGDMSGPLCVVRLASVAVATKLQECLMRIRGQLSLQYSFEILCDSGDAGMSGSPGELGKFWKQQMGRAFDVPLSYADLTGVPAILLLVNKCAMGDTLPANFRFYDLRSKYCKSQISTATAFEQDCGRAFGYGKSDQLHPSRPHLFVHLDTLRFMQAQAEARSKHSHMHASGALKRTAFLHVAGSASARTAWTKKDRTKFNHYRKLIGTQGNSNSKPHIGAASAGNAACSASVSTAAAASTTHDAEEFTAERKAAEKYIERWHASEKMFEAVSVLLRDSRWSVCCHFD